MNFFLGFFSLGGSFNDIAQCKVQKTLPVCTHTPGPSSLSPSRLTRTLRRTGDSGGTFHFTLSFALHVKRRVVKQINLFQDTHFRAGQIKVKLAKKFGFFCCPRRFLARPKSHVDLLMMPHLSAYNCLPARVAIFQKHRLLLLLLSD